MVGYVGRSRGGNRAFGRDMADLGRGGDGQARGPGMEEDGRGRGE